MLDELIEKYFDEKRKLEEIEERLKNIKDCQKEIEKNIRKTLYNIGQLMIKGKSNNFIVERDKVFLFSLKETIVNVNQVDTIKEIKTKLAIKELLK